MLHNGQPFSHIIREFIDYFRWPAVCFREETVGRYRCRQIRREFRARLPVTVRVLKLPDHDLLYLEDRFFGSVVLVGVISFVSRASTASDRAS